MPSEKRKEQEQSASWPPEKKKKKRSRWGNDEMDKTFIPGMPTTLPADATDEQKEIYLLQLQIEDVSRRLRSGDLGIPANPEDRSPSPEPIYNNEGKRMNTREYRVRKALEEERHDLIQKMMQIHASYKPPADYKPPIIRVSDKVMIPQDDHPEINFVGLLIGPRGNTLKNLEKDTGAKIIIRGKGSVKEGKIGRKDGQPLPGEDEPLHAYITANDPENVKKAVEKINTIIKEGIEVPEAQNDLRKQQLRELALLNGTLRDNDGLAKLRQIAEAQTIVTNTIICTACGGAGHIAKDCMQRRPSESIKQALVAQQGRGDMPASSNLQHTDRAKMDSEYMSLMAELGQVAPGTVKADLQSQIRALSAPDNAMGTRISRFDRKEQITTPTTTAAGLSSDYGYGGRRSRFDELGAPTARFDMRGSPNNATQQRFGSPQQQPMQQQQQNMQNQMRFPPSGSFNNSASPNMGGFYSNSAGWNNGPPSLMMPPPLPNMNNRWGAPSPAGNPPAAAPPPPNMSSNPVPPPPPPASLGSPWQSTPASMASSAPWQQQNMSLPGSNALPPWQQPPMIPPGGFNVPPSNMYSPVAPPPPPPGFTSPSYSGFAAPPPPPPQ